MTLNGSWQKLCAGVFICRISLWFGVPAPSSMLGTPCGCESTHVCMHTPGLGTGSCPSTDTCVVLTEGL